MARRWLLVLVLALAACVSPPDAARDGGTRCGTDDDCNGGATCGDLRLCVLSYCTEDTVFRVCANGQYPDAGARPD